MAYVIEHAVKPLWLAKDGTFTQSVNKTREFATFAEADAEACRGEIIVNLDTGATTRPRSTPLKKAL